MFCPRRAPLNPGRALASLTLAHHPNQSRAAGSCIGQVRPFLYAPVRSFQTRLK